MNFDVRERLSSLLDRTRKEVPDKRHDFETAYDVTNDIDLKDTTALDQDDIAALDEMTEIMEDVGVINAYLGGSSLDDPEYDDVDLVLDFARTSDYRDRFDNIDLETYRELKDEMERNGAQIVGEERVGGGRYALSGVKTARLQAEYDGTRFDMTMASTDDIAPWETGTTGDM